LLRSFFISSRITPADAGKTDSSSGNQRYG